MSANNQSKRHWRSAALGAGLTVVLGVALARFPIGQWLIRLSYDLPFAFRPEVVLNDTLLIGIDDRSYEALQQKPGGPLDRALHADLLDRLAQCKLVAFDILFLEPGSPEVDAKLAGAIQRNGKVVLARDLLPNSPGVVGVSLQKIQERFLENAAGWGISRRDNRDSDGVSRRHYAGTQDYPSLPWTAATLAGAPITQVNREDGKAAAARRTTERWLNYYGPDAIQTLSYADAFLPNQSPLLWSNKFVFIGRMPGPQYPGQERDDAPTPYTRWTRKQVGGVEVLATTFLNLYRGDWLIRLPEWEENLALLLTGLLFGAGLRQIRPLPGAALALFGMLTTASLGVWLVWSQGIWFSWVVFAGAQIPFAYVYSLVAHSTILSDRVKAQQTLRLELQEQQARLQEQTAGPAARDQASGIWIPNHTLLRRIGEGAYGEVWLGRNAVGLHVAVKIVKRDKFSSDEPYEREFRGIEKYMPISLSHPGLLQILHVGREDAQGYLFYIMELADDEITGVQIDANRYTPKSLASEIKRQRVIQPEVCVSLMAHLTLALEHLHRAGRIHRDIKPANIIYVRGIPKFADIGLVTDIRSGQAAPTFIGTEGYIAPEGPGTVTSDLYSLGMVLYVACSGLSPQQFPELPTLALNAPTPVLEVLMRIIFKACESNLPRRYSSAAEMHADLVRLQIGPDTEDGPRRA